MEKKKGMPIQYYKFGEKEGEEEAVKDSRLDVDFFHTFKISMQDMEFEIPREAGGLAIQRLTENVRPFLHIAIEGLNYLLLALRRCKLLRGDQLDPVIESTKLFAEGDVEELYFIEISDAEGHHTVCVSLADLWEMKRFRVDELDLVQNILDNGTTVSQKLLLQAMEYRKKSDYRMAVLHAAMALEVSVSSHWTKILEDSGWGSGRIKEFHRRKLTDRLDMIAHVEKKEKRKSDDIITHRNTIAHHLSKGREKTVFDDDDAEKCISNVESILSQLWKGEEIWIYHDPDT